MLGQLLPARSLVCFVRRAGGASIKTVDNGKTVFLLKVKGIYRDEIRGINLFLRRLPNYGRRFSIAPDHNIYYGFRTSDNSILRCIKCYKRPHKFHTETG